MIKESIKIQFDFNLAYAKALIADVSEEQMTAIPSLGLENHPAFTLGHLVVSCGVLAHFMGEELPLPAHWKELFSRSPGDPRMPDTDGTKYPTRQELITALENYHEKIKFFMDHLDESKFDNTTLPWRFDKYFPTLLDFINYVCIHHEAGHLGQVASWRRAMGLPSAVQYL